MKQWIKTLIVSICVFIMGFTIAPAKAFAKAPLDEIQDYVIQVDMRSDGTMDIRYHIEWRVLDSTSEGPLEWVKVGCPNMHVDEITALSDNIKEIRYLADNGAYIRIDFDRQYEANEIVSFDYSIHQSYMYVIEDDAHLCRYSFTPGWFDEIEVKHIRIEWNSSNVIESTAIRTENNYLIWEDELDAGQRLNASVKYNLDVFSANPEEQYTEDYKSAEEEAKEKKAFIILIVVVVIVIIVLIVAVYISDDDYHGGFGGGSHTYIHTHSSCVSRSSCACVSHCACACACAGGGRAGCSKKDFYQYPIKTKDLLEVLDGDLSESKKDY